MSASEHGSRACVRTLHFCFLSCTNFTELYKYSILHCNIYQYIHIWASCLPFKMPGLHHSILDKPAKVNIEVHRIYFRSCPQHMDSALPALHLTKSSTDFSDQLLDRAKPCWAIACTLRWKEADSACSRQKNNKQQGFGGNSQGTWKQPG